MRFYLDTDIWNQIYDQGVEAETLLPALDRHGATLVLGMHVVFEMLKNFDTGSTMRGRQLFTHLRSFVNCGVRSIAKDAFEALVAEMYALNGVTGAKKFLTDSELEVFSTEIVRLSNGEVKSDWFTHLKDQAYFASVDREATPQNLSQNPATKERLLSVSADNLDSWLESEVRSVHGSQILLNHLRLRFPEVAVAELSQYAMELIKQKARTTSAILRADFYYYWRCAHRGSNKRDLLDDMYHVISSAHCNVYITGERKQMEYASHLLPRSVEARAYDRQSGIAEWLLSIARHRAS